MTFDKAIKEIDGCAFIGTSPELVELSDATYIIKQLRKEYAPTVDMSTKQKVVIMSWKRGSTTFNDFINRHPFGFDNLTEEKIMQAWLHPETIKVVDE